MDKSSVNIYRIQLVYFFKEDADFKAFGLTGSLYNSFNDKITTEPQTIPVSEGMPNDFPRCVWNDSNFNLTFNKIRLDFSFNLTPGDDWCKKMMEFKSAILKAISEQRISIDRVGCIAELSVNEKLHDKLNKVVEISNFKLAQECNIAWLERQGIYNIWNYYNVIDNELENKITFDINSLPDYKLSNQGTTVDEAITEVIDILKGKMQNVYEF